GILWIGTISGLYRYDPHNQTMRGFHEQDGLHNTKIWNIAVDHNDNIWAGTNKGLIKLYKSRNGLYKIRTYNIEDGLPSNEFNMGVVTADNDGYLYFGTSDGIIFFNPDSMEDNKYEPKIAITALKIYGVPVSLDKDISFKKRLTIPFDKKVFSVSFAALDYTNPSRNHYSYKLEGYDDVWIDAGSRREAFFTNLDPGKYTLLIKASNNDNVWTSKPLAVSIEIVPPFWLTWWFKGLVALAVILAIGGSIRFIELQKIKRRIEILERQQSLERERSRISKDMHDEIGANLTRISLLSDVVISQAKEAKNDSTLHQISNFANDTIEKLDEIVWAVNPSNDNLKNLIAYIGEYAEGFFSSSEIKCRFNFPSIIPEIPLSSEKRHNFFLVVKEALNNVQKYSSAAYVTLTLLLNESFAGSFKFIIQDDGIGFDCDSVFQTCNGIRNMKERMLSNGGDFELKTKPGEGTEIILIINS
ncbi:MAG TPA: triple tyrosine motif-containing protein, partial [Ignavibacteriaceae bacterium]|nr:triple tyrosine motif-containing protein [Ignavibacteriaceae bacterium]